MGLRVKPVPPPLMTALNSADAEDLRSFLEAERRRKFLCGSDDGEEDEDEDAVQNQESKVVEHEIVDLVSEDELDNWDVDEFSAVVFKRKLENIDIPSSTSNFRSPSIPQAKSETSQRRPRKRNRVSSVSDDLPCLDQPPTVCKIPDNKVVKNKSPRRSPSRSQRPRPSPKFGVSRVFVLIPSSASKFRMPSIPQAASETLQMSPRKRNVSSDSDDLPYQDKSATVYKIPVVKHKTTRQLSSQSQGPRPSPKLSVSSVDEHKQDDSGIQFSTSNFQSPSIPQAKSETLRRSPRKRNRLASQSDDLPCLDQPPTVYKIPENKVVKHKTPRRSSPQSQGPCPSPKLSVSSVVVPSSSSNSRTPSIPQAASEALQRIPRKRNRVSYDSDDLRCQDQPSTVYKIPVVKHKTTRQLSSQSQGPRPSPKLSVSSVDEHKQDKSDIPSSSSNFRTPSIPRAKSETLQRSPRKRNRVSFNSDDLPCKDQSPTVYKIPDNKVVNHKSPQRSSSHSQGPQPSPKLSVSGSESESGYSSSSEQGYNHIPYDNFQFPYHYPYHHHHQSYLPSPHRNYQQQQQQQQQQHSSEMFAPPIPDPRAQFIITQAMHQLSALTPWTPPHDSSFIPHTPSRHQQSRRANSIFNTPNHPHPYPYSYDPNLSLATLPPESSPEPNSSLEKLSSSLSHRPRKSSMARARSRSRARRVSFKIDGGSDRVGCRSEPA